MVVLIVAGGAISSSAQSAPAAPDKLWHADAEHDSLTQVRANYTVDPAKTYTLADLIDLAEEHNPETRLAWQNAKARAASLGIARSALYPTIAAIAVANTSRIRILVNTNFFAKPVECFNPIFRLTI